MILRPLGEAELPLVASWLANPENARWLDFGAGTPALTPTALRLMCRREQHLLRVFAPEPGQPAIGLVALSEIHPRMRTATLWYVLGDKRYAGHGYTRRAVARLLTCAFRERGLHAINAWVVETNVPSIRVLERNCFRLIGRQRECHYLDGRPLDRLLYDLLATEHEERCNGE